MDKIYVLDRREGGIPRNWFHQAFIRSPESFIAVGIDQKFKDQPLTGPQYFITGRGNLTNYERSECLQSPFHSLQNIQLSSLHVYLYQIDSLFGMAPEIIIQCSNRDGFIFITHSFRIGEERGVSFIEEQLESITRAGLEEGSGTRR